MNRTLSTAILLVATLCVAAAPAEARRRRSHSADTPAEKPESDKPKPGAPGKPVQIATFGDWGAYLAAKGRTKTCYTLAQPKERKPDIKRAPAYVFIADRPAEKVRNEVSIIMGYTVKDGAPAQAKIGSNTFDLVAKGSNAWIKNPADEKKFVDTLRRSGKLTVKAIPSRGAPTTDTYVLSGLKQALDRVTQECK